MAFNGAVARDYRRSFSLPLYGKRRFGKLGPEARTRAGYAGLAPQEAVEGGLATLAAELGDWSGAPLPPEDDVVGAAPGDVLLVAATPGWITGQSYMIAAALLCRAPSVLLDGSPVSPPGPRRCRESPPSGSRRSQTSWLCDNTCPSFC